MNSRVSPLLGAAIREPLHRHRPPPPAKQSEQQGTAYLSLRTTTWKKKQRSKVTETVKQSKQKPTGKKNRDWGLCTEKKKNRVLPSGTNTIPAILPSNTPTAPALPNATTILPQLIIFLPPGAAPLEEKAAPAPLHGEGVNSCCHWTFQSLSSFSHTPPPPTPPQSCCREGRTRLTEGTKETGENRAEEKTAERRKSSRGNATAKPASSTAFRATTGQPSDPYLRLLFIVLHVSGSLRGQSRK